MNDLRTFLKDTLHVRNEDVLSVFAREAEIISIEKNTVFVEPDMYQRDMYFLVSGSVRGYLIDDKGNDITIRFAYRPGTALMDGHGVTDYAALYWETLSRVELLRLPARTVQRAVEENQDLTLWALFTIRQMQRETVELQSALVKYSAKDRYLWFKKTYPDFPRNIPQKYVATYLNMLPQTLSQARSSLKKKPETPSGPPKKVKVNLARKSS